MLKRNLFITHIEQIAIQKPSKVDQSVVSKSKGLTTNAKRADRDK